MKENNFDQDDIAFIKRALNSFDGVIMIKEESGKTVISLANGLSFRTKHSLKKIKSLIENDFETK